MTSVYFVQAGVGGPIKIGMSSDVDKRIAQLQTGNATRIHLLAAFEVRDALSVERDLHAEFHDLRLEGEWFRDDERIHALIAGIACSSDYNTPPYDSTGLWNSRAVAAIDAIRSSPVRLVLGQNAWWVVEWSESSRCFHVTTLVESLALSHRQILFGERRPGDYLIVAICESYEEAIKIANQIEPWVRTLNLVRRLGLHAVKIDRCVR